LHVQRAACGAVAGLSLGGDRKLVRHIPDFRPSFPFLFLYFSHQALTTPRTDE
jgi:hypothetical protein